MSTTDGSHPPRRLPRSPALQAASTTAPRSTPTPPRGAPCRAWRCWRAAAPAAAPASGAARRRHHRSLLWSCSRTTMMTCATSAAWGCASAPPPAALRCLLLPLPLRPALPAPASLLLVLAAAPPGAAVCCRASCFAVAAAGGEACQPRQNPRWSAWRAFRSSLPACPLLGPRPRRATSCAVRRARASSTPPAWAWLRRQKGTIIARCADAPCAAPVAAVSDARALKQLSARAGLACMSLLPALWALLGPIRILQGVPGAVPALQRASLLCRMR